MPRACRRTSARMRSRASPSAAWASRSARINRARRDRAASPGCARPPTGRPRRLPHRAAARRHAHRRGHHRRAVRAAGAGCRHGLEARLGRALRRARCRLQRRALDRCRRWPAAAPVGVGGARHERRAVGGGNVATPAWTPVQTPGSVARRAVLAAATPQEVWLLCDHPGDVTRPSGDTAHPASAAPRAASDCGCWFRRSPDRRQGFVQLIESLEVRPVSYRLMDGRAIFEGDIDLGSETEMEALRRREGGAQRTRRRTGGRAARHRAQQRGALAGRPRGLADHAGAARSRRTRHRALESRTRIRFVERTPANRPSIRTGCPSSRSGAAARRWACAAASRWSR